MTSQNFQDFLIKPSAVATNFVSPICCHQFGDKWSLITWSNHLHLKIVTNMSPTSVTKIYFVTGENVRKLFSAFISGQKCLSIPGWNRRTMLKNKITGNDIKKVQNDRESLAELFQFSKLIFFSDIFVPTIQKNLSFLQKI